MVEGERLKELNSHGKAAWLTMQIAVNKRTMTTKEIADSLGITCHGARKMIDSLSEVVPIYQDELWVWQWGGID